MRPTRPAGGSRRTTACGHGTRPEPGIGAPARAGDPARVGAGNAIGPRSAVRCGARPVPQRSCDQFFLAGTAVGSAGVAVRARLTRAEVLLAGAFFAAAEVVLRAGAGFSAERTVDFADSAVPST